MPTEVDAGEPAMAPTGRLLILLRHGESAWNRNKRFTGWTDVELTEKGVRQAVRAGEMLKRRGFVFDECFTSCLQRSTETARLVLATMGLETVPVRRSWRLNERHYGALQGLNWWQAVRRFGPRVLRCQRDFAVAPPALEADDPRHPARDPRYADVPADALPGCESIADTLARAEPYWGESIAPAIRAGRRVLVVSHRNTLCAILKHLEEVADGDFVRMNIPTAKPLVYELDEALRPRRHYFLEEQRAA